MRQKIITLAVVAAVTAALSSCSAPAVDENEALSLASTGAEEGVPILEYDPTWPKRPLPNDGIFGAILAIDVDDEDHVWVMHWPHYIQGGFSSATMKPLAFVSEFDANGELLQQWGEAEDPNLPAPGFEWARDRGGAHGIYSDYKGNIWTGSHTPGARYEGAYANLAKFTNDGTLIMQTGAFGQSTGNADTENFGQPTGIVVDEEANEAFIADGYDNRRVIVIDADTMAFKRMWGAYGNEPVDGPLPARTPDSEPSQQFTGVHCIKMSQDGLLYVSKRMALSYRKASWRPDSVPLLMWHFRQALSSGSSTWPTDQIGRSGFCAATRWRRSARSATGATTAVSSLRTCTPSRATRRVTSTSASSRAAIGCSDLK